MRIEYKGDRISMSKNEYRQVMNELNQYKQAYQHCVDDLIVLRANNERLERENEKQLDLLKKFSGFIHFKLWVSPTSDTYKHYRSELNKLGVK